MSQECHSASAWFLRRELVRIISRDFQHHCCWQNGTDKVKSTSFALASLTARVTSIEHQQHQCKVNVNDIVTRPGDGQTRVTFVSSCKSIAATWHLKQRDTKHLEKLYNIVRTDQELNQVVGSCLLRLTILVRRHFSEDQVLARLSCYHVFPSFDIFADLSSANPGGPSSWHVDKYLNSWEESELIMYTFRINIFLYGKLLHVIMFKDLIILPQLGVSL